MTRKKFVEKRNDEIDEFKKKLPYLSVTGSINSVSIFNSHISAAKARGIISYNCEYQDINQ